MSKKAVPMNLKEFDVGSSSSDSSDPSDLLVLEDEEGWEDVEPDTEDVPFISLFDAEQFPTVQKMLHHCNETYGFDLLKVREDFGLWTIRSACSKSC